MIFLRPHVRDLEIYPELRGILEGFANDGVVGLATHREVVDANTIMPFVDVMVSDYSSIYHDFLLLDRPILFNPYDYEEFERQQGFLYDYLETLPGPAVYTFREFARELESALSGEDRHADRREALTQKIHAYRDADSSRRVSDLVVQALGEA
jgi:CDP-glycerol glycerophosphotransferase (TagB/SpsB family)